MLITREICDQLSDTEIVSNSLMNIDYFSCLYGRYEMKLLRYVQRIAQFDPEEAQDIIQDAFVKIWRNLNDYNPDLKLSSWIYRVVHNETISVWRKKRSFGKDQKVDIHHQNIQDFPDLSSGIIQEESNQEGLIHQVLEQIPLKYKTILVLKFLEGMSYEEISDVLKIPEGTVATRINRAKKAFKQMAQDKKISFFD